MTPFEKLKEFHKAFDLLNQDTPQFPSDEQRKLRMKLLQEEFHEYLESEFDNDLINIGKELADIVYIALGTAVAYGIPMDEIFDEVHRSNMDKLGPDGKVRRREDGKVLKPEGWKPPNINQFF